MKKTPYADCDGELYIRAKYAGMHPLCLLIDCLTITRFGKSSTPYLHIDVAIKWHEDEIKATNGGWKRDTLDTLIEAKNKFAKQLQPA